ncbi:MAG: peptidylprolyl isomerase, partial [Bacteroidetes bacterium]
KKSLISRGPEAEKRLLSDLERFKTGGLADHLIETESGLKLFFHKKTDAYKPKTGDKVSVNYVGALMSGQVFNNSFESGEPFEFVIGEQRVIEGWEEIFTEISEHSSFTLIVPSEMGYGASGEPGKIPENADLIFYIELEKIN